MRDAMERDAQLIRALVRAAAAARARYAITGAHAVAVWGRARPAQDIDVIIALDAKNVGKFIAALKRAGLAVSAADARTACAQRARFVALDTKSNFFFEIKGVYREEDATTLEHARKANYKGAVALFAAPEDIIVQKLILGSEQDIADVRAILAAQKALDHQRLEAMAKTARVLEKLRALKK